MHVARALRDFGKSYVLLSSADICNSAAIFVHGFGGRPTSTWRNFQGLVDQLHSDFPVWDETDLFFYTYNSHRAVQINAQDFSDFMDAIIQGDIGKIAPAESPSLPTLIEKTIPWSPRQYRQVYVLAHSEGAVVARRAILDRSLEIRRTVMDDLGPGAGVQQIEQSTGSALRSDLIMNAKMYLFAPACLGTNFSSVYGFVLGFSDFLRALAASFSSRNDLLPESPILTQLQKETEKASVQYPDLRAWRADILFGENDHMVYVGGYNCDHVLRYEWGHSHTSICKPTVSYTRPLEMVG
jgi:pimeloyl-ACP methyl ester carboxylesterase